MIQNSVRPQCKMQSGQIVSGEEVFSDDVDENVAPEKPQHLEQSALLGHASLLWTCCEPPDLGELQGACWEEIHPNCPWSLRLEGKPHICEIQILFNSPSER